VVVPGGGRQPDVSRENGVKLCDDPRVTVGISWKCALRHEGVRYVDDCMIISDEMKVK
jgi:hypothetical protein